MNSQEEEGVVFLVYRDVEGRRVHHPVRMESCTGRPVPWFSHVYSPSEVKEITVSDLLEDKERDDNEPE